MVSLEDVAIDSLVPQGLQHASADAFMQSLPKAWSLRVCAWVCWGGGEDPDLRCPYQSCGGLFCCSLRSVAHLMIFGSPRRIEVRRAARCAAQGIRLAHLCRAVQARCCSPVPVVLCSPHQDVASCHSHCCIDDMKMERKAGTQSRQHRAGHNSYISR